MSPVRIKDNWREQRIFDRRAIFAGAVMGLLALALFGRLYLLQVDRHEYYSTLSQENRVRTVGDGSMARFQRSGCSHCKGESGGKSIGRSSRPFVRVPFY